MCRMWLEMSLGWPELRFLARFIQTVIIIVSFVETREVIQEVLQWDTFLFSAVLQARERPPF